MIKLATKCTDCIHSKVCRYINNAENSMKKLMDTMYGHGPNDDYYWSTIMERQNIDVVFSCQNFMKNGGITR